MINFIVPPGKQTGLLPRASRYGDVCPLFRDQIEVIPKQHWSALIGKVNLREHVNKIFDQDGEGSCASESATQALQICRSISGQEFVQLNPWSVYFYTKVGGGGSTLDGNLERLRDYGAVPMSLWPRSKGVSQVPSDLLLEARKYRIDEFFDIDNANEAATALLLGMPVAFGWNGHSCVFTRLLDVNGTCEYANSWAPTWGDQGFGQLNLSSVNWSYGMFAYRTALVV